MTIPRRQQISLDHTPYYHCTTRCVRRAFLCGQDRYTGQNFDHRKEWLQRRFITLSRVFAIDLLAYAIMDNHYHVVIRLSMDRLSAWSDAEVVKRWGMVFAVADGVSADQIDCWRERLGSLSWYMRCLNESMARLANREDHCKGRFWEGRFRCQALLDEAALLKCMVYVDLNPIRADIARTPESSAHTSVKARIERKDGHLAPFADDENRRIDPIPLQQQDYLSLVDWSGRQLQSKKRGRIPEHLPPILQRLGIDNSLWMTEMTYYGKWYYRAVGSLHALENYCQHLGQNWLKGKVQMARVSA